MTETLSNKDIAVLILFFVLLILLWISRIWRRIHKKEPGLKEIVEAARGRDFNAENKESGDATEENSSYEKNFFKRTQDGENSVVLETISSMQKCKIVQSLLYSAGIPSYAETQNLSGIFGNTSGLPDTMFSVKLNVLEKDEQTARELLNSSELEDEVEQE